MYYVNLFTTGTPAAKLAQSLAGNAPPLRFNTQRLTIDFANGTAGTVSVQRVSQKSTTGLPANTANVYWVITTTKTGITGTSVTFKYTDADIADFTESALQLYTRPTGGGATAWVPVIGETLNTANNTITATVNSLAEYTIGNVGDSPLPVELSAFTGSASASGVRLSWTTQSEQNNAGFAILRDGLEIATYQNYSTLLGGGTTNEARDYAFTDSGVVVGNSYQYQLRSYDFDGTVHTYPDLITVEFEPDVALPTKYALEQNYPNPFNPTTRIEYALPEASEVSLKVFDMIGREVATLVSGRQSAGVQVINFNAAGLASRVYFYRIDARSQTGSFSQTKKMMLVK